MIGSIIWGAFAGLFRALFAPIAQWLHDRRVRAEAINKERQREAEATLTAIREAKRDADAIDQKDRAAINDIAHRLYKRRHSEADGQ